MFEMNRATGVDDALVALRLEDHSRRIGEDEHRVGFAEQRAGATEDRACGIDEGGAFRPVPVNLGFLCQRRHRTLYTNIVIPRALPGRAYSFADSCGHRTAADKCFPCAVYLPVVHPESAACSNLL